MPLTIHALDPEVEKRIRGLARKQKKSLNQTLKELLAAGVGQPSAQPPHPGSDFKEFSGVWSEEDEQAFMEASEELQRVDPDDWS